MSIAITLLTVFLVMVSLLLLLVTLMQRPKQEGLGAAFGGGMMNDTFGAQTTDVLQKSTVWLTVAFFGTAILLSVLNTRYYESQRDVGNVLEEVRKAEPIPSFPTPGADPSVPSLPGIPAIPTPAVPDSKEAAPEAEKTDKAAQAEKPAPVPAKAGTKSPETAKPATDPAAKPAGPAPDNKPAADKAPAKTGADTPAAEKKDAK